jgi:NAD(P)-dependent dehydrogenase (short-subunit alcohol dehydrogenase family)
MPTTPTPRAKIALISGSSGYLGSEIARKLGEEGYTVVPIHHSSLAQSESIQEIIRTIVSEQGDLEVCVHAAWSPLEYKNLTDCTDADMRRHFEENVYPSFNLLRACAAHFAAQKRGTIIGITTAYVLVAPRRQSKGLGGYIPAKYAVQGMLATLREEVAASGVQVYAVAPGFMDGGLNRDVPKVFVDMLKAKSPGSVARREDVAAIVADLCAGKSTPAGLTISIPSIPPLN